MCIYIYIYTRRRRTSDPDAPREVAAGGDRALHNNTNNTNNTYYHYYYYYYYYHSYAYHPNETSRRLAANAGPDQCAPQGSSAIERMKGRLSAALPYIRSHISLHKTFPATATRTRADQHASEADVKFRHPTSASIGAAPTWTTPKGNRTILLPAHKLKDRERALVEHRRGEDSRGSRRHDGGGARLNLVRGKSQQLSPASGPKMKPRQRAEPLISSCAQAGQ